MKQLHFYEVLDKEGTRYLKDWVNWTGAVPTRGDILLMHFGDYNEREVKYSVLFRLIDGTDPENITIYVRPF